MAGDNTAYQSKSADLENLRGQIETLRQSLEGAQQQQSDLRTRLAGVEQAIAALNARLKEYNVQLQTHTRRVNELDAEKRRLQGELDAQSTALGRQLRAAYILGGRDDLKILLNQEDPARLGRHLAYYDYLNRARMRRIEHYGENLKQRAAVTESIGQQVSTLKKLEATQKEEKQLLELGQQTRSQILAGLDSEISVKNEELSRLLEDERRLQVLLPTLQRQAPAHEPEPGGGATGNRIPGAADHAPFAMLKGKLPWPSQGALIARYDSPRLGGQLKWHGVLIQAPEGTAVRAIAAGQIVFAGELRGFGLLVIIDHGDGYMSLYGYNRELHKKSGDWVEAGGLIAAVGLNAAEEPGGLYFEIRAHGEPNNPAQWCVPPA
ncbi:MAG: peptidoglycan DD-metalloendopeptidase family protein [Gammaproteobacteria bacterium]